MRRGISLLEVLISIFVILVGLLGVLGLVAAGSRETTSAMLAFRSASAGKAAMADANVRRYFDPSLWLFADGTAFDESSTGSAAFAIDPLWVANNSGASGMNRYPSGSTLLYRMSIENGVTGGVMSEQLAERTFRFSDDVSFVSDVDSRPGTLVDDAGRNSFAGEYSWFVTAYPKKSESDIAWSHKTNLSCSIVVCRRRDFSSPNPVATVDFINDDPTTTPRYAVQAGDVELTFSSEEDASVLESCRWVLLCNQQRASWHRVLSVSSETDPSVPLARQASLQGPDWSNDDTVFAVLDPSVVNVCSKQVEMDQ